MRDAMERCLMRFKLRWSDAGCDARCNGAMQDVMERWRDGAML